MDQKDRSSILTWLDRLEEQLREDQRRNALKVRATKRIRATIAPEPTRQAVEAR